MYERKRLTKYTVVQSAAILDFMLITLNESDPDYRDH